MEVELGWNRITRSAVYNTTEIQRSAGWAKWGEDMILQQCSWNVSKCVTDGEQLSPRMKMRGTFTSVGHEFEASRSVAGFKYPGIESRTLLAKDMSLNVCVP